MKTLTSTAAICSLMILASTQPIGAQDINIHIQGTDVTTSEPEAGDRYQHRHGMHHRSGHHRRDHSFGKREGWGRAAGMHGRRSHEAHRIDKVLRLIELYDLDGDDKVVQSEIDKARSDRLAAFDADGDGTLSLQEYEALWLDAMRERMVDRFQSHDDDGDGHITPEEFSERTSHLVLRRDRNEDGAISLEEARRKHGRVQDDGERHH